MSADQSPAQSSLHTRCQTRLQERERLGLLRTLPGPNTGVDFVSNDYLGLAREAPSLETVTHGGATGSRLLSGDCPEAQALEQSLTEFHQSEAALLFGSGYLANIGILQALCERGDLIFYDQYCHASLRDGIQLSFADAYSFAHNNLDELEQLLKRHPARPARLRWLVLESIYSMDGDAAPLAELCALAARYDLQLMVDEAHATGVYGPQGQGLVQALGLQDAVAVRMHSFGKAVGYHGAAALASRGVIQLLQNFSRSFIYTTAQPPAACMRIQQHYRALQAASDQRSALQELIAYFSQCARRSVQLAAAIPQRSGPIQIVICPGNQVVRQLAESLRQRGHNVRAVLSPTVPKGQERLRLVLHSFNTKAEVAALLTDLEQRMPQAAGEPAPSQDQTLAEEQHAAD